MQSYVKIASHALVHLSKSQLQEAEREAALDKTVATMHGLQADQPRPALGPIVMAPVSVDGLTRNAWITLHYCITRVCHGDLEADKILLSESEQVERSGQDSTRATHDTVEELWWS